ncbi:MAG: insulinase family protein, partial [Bacillales bacterium]
KDAEQRIADGEKEYRKSLLDYEEALRKYQKERADALAELDARQEELQQSRVSVIDAIKQIEESGILNQHKQLMETILYLEGMLSQIDNPDSEEYIAIESQLNQAKMAAMQIEETGVIQKYEELKRTLAQIDAGQEELDKGREEANHKFAAVEAQLAEAKAQLDAAKIQIEKNKQEILKGWQALEKGKAEYEKGLNDYEKAKKEAEVAKMARKKRNEANKIVERDNISQAKLHIGYRTNCTYKDDGYFALQVFNGLYGGFPISRLFMNVREKHSLAYYVASRIESHVGLLVVYSGVETAKYERAYQIIEEQFTDLKNGHFTEDELTHVKKLITSSIKETLDHPTGTIELLYQQIVGERELPPETLIENINRVKKEDVIAIAEQIELDTIYVLASEEGE